MANRQRDMEKERFWRELLSRQAASGLSVRAFCRQEGLGESSLHAWRRTIRERDGEAANAKTPSQKIPSPAFVPAVVNRESSHIANLKPHEAGITIELAGGHLLRLPTSTSNEQVAELAVALELKTLAAKREAAKAGATKTVAAGGPR